MAQQTANGEIEASEPTTTTTTERTAEIYYLPFSGEPEITALREGIRFEDETPTQEQATASYDRIGSETITAGNVDEALGRVWAGWNRGSGNETRAFAEAQVRSLSVADIIVLDGETYLCQPFGWNEIEVDPSKDDG